MVYSNLSFDGCLRSRPTHIYQAVLQSKLYCRFFWYNFTKWDLEFSWKFTCKSKKSCYKLFAKDWNDSCWKRLTLNSFTGNWSTKMLKSNFSSTLLFPFPFILTANKQDKFDQNQLSNFFTLIKFWFKSSVSEIRWGSDISLITTRTTTLLTLSSTWRFQYQNNNKWKK